MSGTPPSPPTSPPPPAMGEGNVECIFAHAPRSDDQRLLILGLYPPSDSDVHKEHDNATSREISKVTGNDLFLRVERHLPVHACRQQTRERIRRSLPLSFRAARFRCWRLRGWRAR